MTLESLMNRAAAACLDEREQHLAIFTEGANGYVCRNEGLTDESQALFHGTYRDCQVWIERRGIAAALRYVSEHMTEVPNLADEPCTLPELIERIANISNNLTTHP
jgi:hypothetical protein